MQTTRLQPTISPLTPKLTQKMMQLIENKHDEIRATTILRNQRKEIYRIAIGLVVFSDDFTSLNENREPTGEVNYE